MALAVISACLPTLRPIYLRYNSPPSSYANSSGPYKSASSRFGSHRYGRSDSFNEEIDVPLTERGPAVQTYIETTYHENAPQPKDGAIMVSQDISSVKR